MKSSSYILTTTLKTRDAVAGTAFQTLTHDMNYKDILVELTRDDWWKIDLLLDDNAPEPDDAMVELAEKTRVFVNVNKHSYSIYSENSHPFELVRTGDNQYCVYVLIKNRDDRAGKNALKTLQALYSAGQYVRKTENGILWKMIIRAESDSKAKHYAEQIAVAETRNRGLLSNRHYQTHTIL